MSKVLVVYWSGTGNTESMANQIKDGLASTGLEAIIKPVDEVSSDYALTFDKIAFGCSSMGVESLEEEIFAPFFESVLGGLSGKKVAIFGSYGWGDGAWLITWGETIVNNGGLLFESGLKVLTTPGEDEEKECFDFGKRFASF
jgi:flavodoxin short chain